jgi:phosphatidylserine synthase
MDAEHRVADWAHKRTYIGVLSIAVLTLTIAIYLDPTSSLNLYITLLVLLLIIYYQHISKSHKHSLKD